MIASVRGEVLGHRPGAAIVDVCGVGYLVHMPSDQLADLTQGADVILFVSTVVREDAITLYGFVDDQQRELFEILRQVKGVGPRLALAMLGHMSSDGLVHALVTKDENAIVAVPGVGKRIASRLVLELSDKIPSRLQTGAIGVGIVSGKSVAQDPLPLALSQLGYRKSEIDMAMGSADVPRLSEAPVEARLSAALRVLQRQ